SWRAPPDDRRLSYLDATGLDGPLDRLLARYPPGDGLQHPRPRPAADPDGLGHQHPPLEIRVSLEYRRTGREEANPGQVGDGVAADGHGRHPGRRDRSGRVEPPPDRRLSPV